MVYAFRKKHKQLVGMPQMALNGLSESWLMKEIGDIHWHMLCESLGLKSNDIYDEFGNRLYAAFVRIKTESSNSLKDYIENDFLNISAATKRINSCLYFSEIDINCEDKSINCCLATNFTLRESEYDNSKMTRGIPSSCRNEDMMSVTEMPSHILDIIKLKKSKVSSVVLSDHKIDITDNVIFEKEYKVNPYTDINGVGLLYFAAYPLINDVCELEYFHDRNISTDNWSMYSSTMARDVYYFANCNIDDVIIYKLNSYQIIDNEVITLQSSIYRKSDATLMAKIFTVKQMKPFIKS